MKESCRNSHHSCSVVLFVITITSVGFHSASSICSGGLMTMPVQRGYCLFPLHISTIYLFLFWRWAAQRCDDSLILLPAFCAKSMQTESVKYQHSQGIYDADMWSHSVSVHQWWTKAFHAVSGNRKGEIWSELDCPLQPSLMPLPLSVRRIEQKRAALLLGSLACEGGVNTIYMIPEG